MVCLQREISSNLRYYKAFHILCPWVMLRTVSLCAIQMMHHIIYGWPLQATYEANALFFRMFISLLVVENADHPTLGEVFQNTDFFTCSSACCACIIFRCLSLVHESKDSFTKWLLPRTSVPSRTSCRRFYSNSMPQTKQTVFDQTFSSQSWASYRARSSSKNLTCSSVMAFKWTSFKQPVKSFRLSKRYTWMYMCLLKEREWKLWSEWQPCGPRYRIYTLWCLPTTRTMLYCGRRTSIGSLWAVGTTWKHSQLRLRASLGVAGDRARIFAACFIHCPSSRKTGKCPNLRQFDTGSHSYIHWKKFRSQSFRGAQSSVHTRGIMIWSESTWHLNSIILQRKRSDASFQRKESFWRKTICGCEIMELQRPSTRRSEKIQSIRQQFGK